MTARFEEKLEFLRSRDADTIGHSERSLLAHLLGCRRLLISWGAGAPLVDAGLFHSVYGTEFFRSPSIPESDRSLVRNLIGTQAERLVWLYCRLQRTHFESEASRGTPDHIVDHAFGSTVAIARDEVAAIANLLAADCLEQLLRHPSRSSRRAERYFQLRSHLLPGAIHALAEIRNASLIWRLIAVALAIGSVSIPWLVIAGDPRQLIWPLAARETAITCGLLVSSAMVVAAQPHRMGSSFALFGLAPLAWSLFGTLFGWDGFKPAAILPVSLAGLGAAALGVAIGRKAASFRARHAAQTSQTGFADKARPVDSDFETQ